MTENPKYLIVDLFCGAGGTTIGFEQSGVAKVIAAVNHDPKAITSHWANHPNVIHFEEDIRTLDVAPLVTLVKQQRNKYPDAHLILWASLECTNFSNAKGGAPREADSRTLADHLFRYLDIEPDYIKIENVREFQSWGPLDENGKPISKHNGRDWLRWKSKMCNLGFQDHWTLMNAADYGARTSRTRLFGSFVRTGLPMVWPEPTHSKNPASDSLFDAPLKKWLPCKPCLDLEEHGQSIFEPNRIKSDKTFGRIYGGLLKYVAQMKEEDFLIKYMGNNPNTGLNAGKSINDPCNTLTTGNRLALTQTVMLNSYYGGTNTCQTTDDPAPTVTTKDRFSAVFLDKQYGSGNHNHQSTDEPCGSLPTVPKVGIVQPLIMNTNFNNLGQELDKPLSTITANRKWHYLLNPQYSNGCKDTNDPCFTLIARMDKAPPSLVSIEGGGFAIEVLPTDSETVIKIKHFMAVYGLVDIKMRMLKIVELKRIQGFPDDYQLHGSQADQKKFIGNSVVPQVVKAWILALADKHDSFQQSQIA